MGLYDRYKLSNSTVVPKYVGSALPELTNAFEKAQERYTIASSSDEAMAQAVLGADVLEQDKEKWRVLNEQTQKEIEDRRIKGDYENMYGIVAQRAQQAAAVLKPLAEQVAAKANFYKSVDASNLSEFQKAAVKQMGDERYKGVQLDGSGRIVPGTEYQGKRIVKNVDKMDKITKALSLMHAKSGERITMQENRWGKITTGGKWEAIKAEDVAAAVEAARAIDVEWQDSDAQELELATYSATRGMTDAAVVKNWDKMDPITKAGVEKYTALGLSKGDAARAYVKAQIERSIKSKDLAFGLTKVYDNRSTEYKQEMGEWDKLQAKADFEKTQIEGITIPIPLQDAHDDETFDDVKNKIKELTPAVEAAKATASQWIKLDPKTGEPLMRVVNGRKEYIPAKEGLDITNAPTDVQKAINALDMNARTITELKNRRASALDEAAASTDPKFRAPDGSTSGAYNRMLAATNNAVINLLDKPMYNLQSQGRSRTALQYMTKEQLVEAINTGEATINPDGASIRIKGRGVVNIDSKTENKIKREMGLPVKVSEKAKANYKTMSKNASVAPLGYTPDWKQPALSNFGTTIANTINSQKDAMTAFKVDGKDLEVGERDAAIDLNATGSRLGTVYKRGNNIVVTGVGIKDGKEVPYEAVIPATSDINMQLYTKLQYATDPSTQKFARAINPYSQVGEINALQPGETVQLRGTKMMVKNNGQNEFVVVLPDGSQMPSAGGGLPFFTTTAELAEDAAINYDLKYNKKKK